MSIEEIMSEKRLIDDEINDITNDLSYKRFRGEQIDDEYERDCEIKINNSCKIIVCFGQMRWRKKERSSNGRKDIECEDSYDSNLDESTFLVTPLSDSNEDGFFTPRDDIELLLHHDPSISLVSILEGIQRMEPASEENDDLFDLESKESDWKKILYDAPIDDLITEDKVFNPGIHDKSFSPTFVK
ncbi:hypothetical protein Tco_0578350 [Tanacetum coccineum]